MSVTIDRPTIRSAITTGFRVSITELPTLHSDAVFGSG